MKPHQPIVRCLVAVAALAAVLPGVSLAEIFPFHLFHHRRCCAHPATCTVCQATVAEHPPVVRQPDCQWVEETHMVTEIHQRPVERKRTVTVWHDVPETCWVKRPIVQNAYYTVMVPVTTRQDVRPVRVWYQDCVPGKVKVDYGHYAYVPCGHAHGHRHHGHRPPLACAGEGCCRRGRGCCDDAGHRPPGCCPKSGCCANPRGCCDQADACCATGHACCHEGHHDQGDLAAEGHLAAGPDVAALDEHAHPADCREPCCGPKFGGGMVLDGLCAGGLGGFGGWNCASGGGSAYPILPKVLTAPQSPRGCFPWGGPGGPWVRRVWVSKIVEVDAPVSCYKSFCMPVASEPVSTVKPVTSFRVIPVTDYASETTLRPETYTRSYPITHWQIVPVTKVRSVPETREVTVREMESYTVEREVKVWVKRPCVKGA
jgi:hypothetical protein